MYKLVISDDEGKNTVVPLVRDEITIGRKEGNTIRLTERNVSRRHARLVKASGRFVIEDLHSYNGVRINGQRIAQETALDPGDQSQIGDYQLALQVDGTDAQTLPEQMSPAVADADTAMLAAPGPPARLVMITPPAPGAEFALTGERTRLGRAEDLDIWVNHRSISREHAEIQKEPDGGLRLIDLGSANGIRVNGKDVQNALLAAGDVVELGQVRFRFVAAGEHYAFDADRTVQMDAVVLDGRSSSRAPLFVAIAIVGLAIVGAGVVAFWGSGDDDGQPIQARPDPGIDPTEDPTPTAPVADYATALRACQTALTQARWADAIAQADAALGQRPEDADATACRSSATLGQGDESTFTSGLAHFRAGAFEPAYFDFENLAEGSPYRTRPEVAQAVQGYANVQITAGQAILDSDATEALRIAQFVLNMQGITATQRALASALERAAQQRGARGDSVAAVNPRPRGGRPPRERPRGTDRGTSNENGGAQQQQQQSSATPDHGGGSPPRGGGPGDLEAQARECTRHGDNACVIRLLEGRAHTDGGLAMLIEAYRARGQTQQALRHMQEFVRRFPGSSRARSYQQIIASHGGG